MADPFKYGIGQKIFMLCHLDNMIPPAEAEEIVKGRMALRRKATPEQKKVYDKIFKDRHGRYIRPKYYGYKTSHLLESFLRKK